MHIFPGGEHGKGLPIDDAKELNHIKQWIELLKNGSAIRIFIANNYEIHKLQTL